MTDYPTQADLEAMKRQLTSGLRLETTKTLGLIERIYELQAENETWHSGYKNLQEKLALSDDYVGRLLVETSRLNEIIEAGDNSLIRVTEQYAEADGKIDAMRVALDRLARLGNYPHYGNSEGNDIAIDALRATGFLEKEDTNDHS